LIVSCKGVSKKRPSKTGQWGWQAVGPRLVYNFYNEYDQNDFFGVICLSKQRTKQKIVLQ
jgi:hypothetical protein